MVTPEFAKAVVAAHRAAKRVTDMAGAKLIFEVYGDTVRVGDLATGSFVRVLVDDELRNYAALGA
jgi:hypothetical protein